MAVYYGEDSYDCSYIVWNDAHCEQMTIICELRGVYAVYDNEFSYCWHLDYDRKHDEMMEMVEIIKTAGMKVKEDNSKILKKRGI